MNKFTQNFFLILFPFLPFWAWILSLVTDVSIGSFICLAAMPIAVNLLLSPKFYLPKYLIFLLFFTFYHIGSAFINNPVLSFTWILFLLADNHVLACILFFIIENTRFDDRFVRKMSQNIFIIVLITLVFSLVQIKFPTFFVSPTITLDPDNIYFSENRIFSIFSWLNLNSLGITFPILIAILLSVFGKKKMKLPLIIISGIIVSFLTKARYVMLSTIIVFSQLLFTATITFRKKVYIFLIFIASIFVLFNVSRLVGYDIQQVIDDRILEKESQMGSAKTRIISYFVFLEAFPEHPVFGVGPETQIDVLRALGGSAPLIHVGYLSYLYFYGLAGSFLLFISLYYLLRDTWRIGKKHMFWGGFYGLLSFCFANATMVYFNFSEMGVVLIVIYMKYYKGKASVKLPEFKPELKI
jgi:hypothetical protein